MAGSALLARGIDQRRAILRFVKKYQKSNGVSPSVQEIADDLGLSSKTAVRHHLDTLKDEGWVDWSSGKHRSLRLLKPDARYPN